MRRPNPIVGLRVHVAENFDSLSRQGADLILRELKQRPDLLLCASAGGSPTGAYSRLAERSQRHTDRFEQLRVLQIDEWGGLPASSPATCRNDLRQHLLQPLKIAPNRYCGFRSDAPDPQAECARLRRWLAAHGPIDVCILGLGLNGHIAMNEPAASIHPHAHVAKLAPSSLKHPLLRDLPRKPRYGLSLGMADILQSRLALLLVSGAHKRKTLHRLLQPRITPVFPASFLWLHPRAILLCDRDAFGDGPNTWPS